MTKHPMFEKLVVGGLIKFRGERNPYRIQAFDDRFVICTKPFAPRKTVIYAIVDFKRDVRGPDNMIFGRGYETREDCEMRLLELNDESVYGIEVSYRRSVPLDVEYVKESDAPRNRK